MKDDYEKRAEEAEKWIIEYIREAKQAKANAIKIAEEVNNLIHQYGVINIRRALINMLYILEATEPETTLEPEKQTNDNQH